MTYCTNCGAALQPQWRFCATCSAPSAAALMTVTAPQVPAQAAAPVAPFASPRLSRLWLPAAASTLLAGVATLAALFPAYYGAGGNLAHTPENLWFNLPAIAGWFVAAALLGWPRTRQVGAGLLLGVTLAWVGNYFGNIGAVVTGAQHPAVGFALGVIGIVVAVIASALAAAAAVAAGGRLSARAAAPLWAMLAGAVGVVWAVGDAMDWEQTKVHATIPGYTFRATGTATVTQSCCTLLDNHGWALAGQIVLVAAAVAVPLVAAAWRPVSFGVGTLIGAALALFASPLSAIVRLSKPVTPASLGISDMQVTQGGVVISHHGLLGLWLAVLAAVVLVLVAAGRALHAAGQR